MVNASAKLNAQSPCFGLVPIEHGTVRVVEVEPAHISAIAPFKGKTTAVNKALSASFGVRLPAVGRRVEKDAVACLWFDHSHAMLIGAKVDESLSSLAAVTDQSDGWAVLNIAGDHVLDVLARLVPMDLRTSAFGTGSTARTMLQHIPISLSRLNADTFQIIAMRSMARSVVHELDLAMENVAARG